MVLKHISRATNINKKRKMLSSKPFIKNLIQIPNIEQVLLKVSELNTI
jgi:hypothetical protein